MSTFTCLTCAVQFSSGEIQRDHYKTDWHRYNLKRKVAELPPVTAEEFQKRVFLQRNTDELANQQRTLYCNACRTKFSTEKALENHMNSKKHLESTKDLKEGESVTVEKVKSPTAVKMVVEEEDESDEWDEDANNPIANNNCIFCNKNSEDFVANMKHMSVEHSFFIPDAEYCTDVEGLMMYLGEKVAAYYICLWCNDRGRTFYTLDACRKHMVDKGHCKMLHEGLALAEYADYYDYSSSYPDNEEGMDVDAEFEPEILDGDEYQLVLPSGAVIGHRSLMRYYKQKLNPNRQLVPAKSNKKLHKVLAEYRSLGWTNTQQVAAAKKARDIHHMKRQYAKWSMKMGVKANKFQKHYREQVNF